MKTKTNYSVADFAELAISQIGIPYITQEQQFNHCLDCGGLVIACVRECGINVEVEADYNTAKSEFSPVLLKYTRQVADEVATDKMRVGDIVLFWLFQEHQPMHVGIVVASESEGFDFDFVHTCDSAGKVRREEMTENWIKHRHSVWRVRGLE